MDTGSNGLMNGSVPSLLETREPARRHGPTKVMVPANPAIASPIRSLRVLLSRNSVSSRATVSMFACACRRFSSAIESTTLFQCGQYQQH